MTTTAERDATPRRRVRLRHLLAGWATLVALVLLWQLLTYRGLMALAAEWQFNAFGRYYPALTYVLLTILLASPILWLLRGGQERAATALPGRTFIRAILGLAVACAVGSAIAALTMAMQPDDQGAAARVTIGSAAATTPAEGATIVVGDVVADRVAGLSEDLFLARRSFRFVPMVAPDARGDPIRYVAEIDGADTLATARRDGALTGILKRNALPGEIGRLFRYAGFDIAEPHYVLFASRASLQWPYRVIAAELALVAALCALAALGLHVRRERMRQGDDEHPGKSLPAG